VATKIKDGSTVTANNIITLWRSFRAVTYREIVMRVSFVEWPDGLRPGRSEWARIAKQVVDASSDVLITNELPFGPWIASDSVFDHDTAAASLTVHEHGIAALFELGLPAVLSSRPVWEGNRLANEAIILEDGAVRGVHRKQLFPDEPGWYETSWYGTSSNEFETASMAGLSTGVLLCTEAMFTEHARGYGLSGAILIAVPRATGVSTRPWHIAGAMAALSSGSYVVSSNRTGQAGSRSPRFGGSGFAYAPGGELIGITSPTNPLVTFNLDPEKSRSARLDFPCYVEELNRRQA